MDKLAWNQAGRVSKIPMEVLGCALNLFGSAAHLSAASSADHLGWVQVARSLHSGLAACLLAGQSQLSLPSNINTWPRPRSIWTTGFACSDYFAVPCSLCLCLDLAVRDQLWQEAGFYWNFGEIGPFPSNTLLPIWQIPMKLCFIRTSLTGSSFDTRKKEDWHVWCLQSMESQAKGF